MAGAGTRGLWRPQPVAEDPERQQRDRHQCRDRDTDLDRKRHAAFDERQNRRDADQAAEDGNQLPA